MEVSHALHPILGQAHGHPLCVLGEGVADLLTYLVVLAPCLCLLAMVVAKAGIVGNTKDFFGEFPSSHCDPEVGGTLGNNCAHSLRFCSKTTDK
eukprot:3839981-Lingulodinium_polyedra.AAC.1